MTPFRVDWSAEAVGSVLERVRAYRFPPAPTGEGWRYGCDEGFLRRLCEDWSERYDWRAAVERLNRFPQFTAEVDGVRLHVLHIVGEAEGRRPLLLLHGWPGSIREFWRVVEPLAFPTRHGGRAEDAFDLVIPSLPNFGFSDKPAATIDQRRAAALMHRLMRETLGYSTFRIHGGDWGAMIASLIALDHGEGVEAIHLTMPFPSPSTPPRTAEETAWTKAAADVQSRLGAYVALQGTKPQSLSLAVGDSPVGQASWLLERFHDWSDLRERPFEAVFSREDLLDTAMIYVMTGAFHSSIRFYAAAAETGVRRMPEGRRVEVPTAFALFPDPRLPPIPRSLAETAFSVSRWREMPRGGHFPALEVPDLLVEELRDWGRER